MKASIKILKVNLLHCITAYMLNKNEEMRHININIFIYLSFIIYVMDVYLQYNNNFTTISESILFIRKLVKMRK